MDILLDGERIGITSGDTPSPPPAGIVHLVNQGDAGVGLLVASYWEGATGSPYINNDCTLFQVYSKLLSNSANRSWAASCSNNYRDIPAGMTDSGEAVGVIGWAGSVAQTGYVHAGTHSAQCGVKGTAGFQGAGSAATAVISEANGVQGLIYADSAGATITLARAGAFASDGGLSVVQTNVGVFARAINGTVANYSFWGAGGTLWNQGPGQFDQYVTACSTVRQSSSSIAARKGGNSLEFGYPSTGGYGSNLGATYAHGYPFLIFCGEADATGDTFTTRGKCGAGIWSDLAGSLVFSRLTNASASGQSMAESARFDANGNLKLAAALALPIGSVPNYANDAAAATGGVGIGGVYRTGSALMIRVT